MRKTSYRGNFLLVLLINMILNAEGLIPSLILLVLHFLLDISILWFVGALAVWILGLVFWMLVIRWAGRCGTPDLPRKNKNPYSVGAQKKEDQSV